MRTKARDLDFLPKRPRRKTVSSASAMQLLAMRALLRDHGLTIALLLLFAGSAVGHFLAGHAYNNQELQNHGQAAIGLLAYAREDQYRSTLFENWESEFLQMSTYVVLTAYLFQRGSAESADPDAPPRDECMTGKIDRRSPAALRSGAAIRWMYAHSLGVVLFLLFVASFIAHAFFSARESAAQALLHGQQPVGALAYLSDAEFWFESFQNWQSEFLSTAMLVVLSIFLREKGSPESKPVGAPHAKTGA